MSGTVHYPLTEQMADTIRAHGKAWAFDYYYRRIRNAREFWFLFASALRQI